MLLGPSPRERYVPVNFQFKRPAGVSLINVCLIMMQADAEVVAALPALFTAPQLSGGTAAELCLDQ